MDFVIVALLKITVKKKENICLKVINLYLLHKLRKCRKTKQRENDNNL